ncbi:cytochrome P450 [Kitasatospora sp. NPDC094019]|uniref:cytochrome P450 n=1 Tax=Kitasatospora sp. NPDC094019 TaxID=3364091 RepID=UPI0037F3F5A9
MPTHVPDHPRPPGRLPLLGDALSLRRDPLGFLESLRGLADLAELRIGPQRVYLPTTAALTRSVLTEQARHFHKGAQFEKLRPVIGDGLASAEGRAHRRQRALVQPAFHRSRFPAYLRVAARTTADRVDSWQDGRTLEMDRQMYRLAASIGTRILYHSHLDDGSEAVIDDAGLTVVRGIGKRVTAPFGLAERLPTPTNRRYRAAVASLHQVVSHIVEARRDDGHDHHDLLSVLLHSQDRATGDRLTDQQVHDEVITMLGGATESTAVSLSWTLYELARHPDVELRVLEELDTALGARDITVDDLDALPLLRRVVDETLRLEGPAWMLTRRVAGTVEVGGRTLPAGTALWYSPYLLHHDPAAYPDPHRFDPDRWLTTPAGATGDAMFIPFGAGIRACVGESLARAELLVVLATLLQRWRFHLVPGARVRKVAGFVLSPSSLPMTVTRRPR